MCGERAASGEIDHVRRADELVVHDVGFDPSGHQQRDGAPDHVVAAHQDVAIVAPRHAQSQVAARGAREIQQIAVGAHVLGEDVAADQQVGVLRPLARDRPGVEGRIAAHVDVAEKRVPAAGVHVDPVGEVVEHDVVDDPLLAALTRRVDAVVEVLVRPVVVEDAAVQLRRPLVLPEAHALLSGVVNDEVDELAIGPVGLERVVGVGRRARLSDLEPPVDRVRAVHVEIAVDRGPLAWVLAHDDRRGARAGEGRVEPAGIGPAPQPDRVAGPDGPAPAAQRGRQVPRVIAAAVAGPRPAGRYVVARGAGRVDPEAQHHSDPETSDPVGSAHRPPQWNSNAPMSSAAPCGRLTPRTSLLT